MLVCECGEGGGAGHVHGMLLQGKLSMRACAALGQLGQCIGSFEAMTNPLPVVGDLPFAATDDFTGCDW